MTLKLHQLIHQLPRKENDLAQDVPGETADIIYADVPMVCDPNVDPYCPGAYDSINSCGSSEYHGWPRPARYWNGMRYELI